MGLRLSTEADIARIQANHKSLSQKVLSVEKSVNEQLTNIFDKVDELTKTLYDRPPWWVLIIITGLSSAVVGLLVRMASA